MKKSVIYIHGKGGNAEEAEHYKPLFKDYDVIGFDYGCKISINQCYRQCIVVIGHV